ncbi:MAG: hypothetical protein R3207_01100 [Oceanospirillum sp.]|nr:hypothetical protein [Oceanospirillum sp.]
MTTLFSLMRYLLLIALMATGMVMPANSANAAVMSAAQFYAESADPLAEETKRLKTQTEKALQLHKQLVKNQISTREAFHNYLYNLSIAEELTEDILNPARFRMGIPSKRGIEPKHYPAIQISLTKDKPRKTRSADIRDLIRQENRRYEDLLKDSEDAFEDVQELLVYLGELRQQIASSRTGKEAKRKYELYLRRLSSAKAQYYSALNEFCVAAAQAEFNGLTGKRLIPGGSPFQLSGAGS